MRNTQEMLRMIARNLVANVLSKDPREWPPTCSFLAYQPVRPQISEAEQEARTVEAKE